MNTLRQIGESIQKSPSTPALKWVGGKTLQNGSKIGATAIAKEAGVSRRTANNYRHIWG